MKSKYFDQRQKERQAKAAAKKAQKEAAKQKKQQTESDKNPQKQQDQKKVDSKAPESSPKPQESYTHELDLIYFGWKLKEGYFSSVFEQSLGLIQAFIKYYSKGFEL